ncbi:hypothetical protein PG995_009242 [Apiospora arundinis]
MNLEALTPHDANYVYITSYWSPVNATAMKRCCAPRPAKDVGCYTWCELPEDDVPKIAHDSSGRGEWKLAFHDCLDTQGREVSKNPGYVAPLVGTAINKESVAACAAPGGVKGALLTGLLVPYWVLTV